MNITELQQSYASHPNVEGVCRLLKDNSVRHLYCGGLYASAASLFSSVLVQRATCPLVFILGDMEEAVRSVPGATSEARRERTTVYQSEQAVIGLSPMLIF